MTRSYSTSQVFVAGGQPRHTYVPRVARNLEGRLAAAAENLFKLVTVTGPTKSGKTVLASKVFPRSLAIWVDGGTVAREEDLWTTILGATSGHTEIQTETSRSSTTTASGEVGGGFQLPLFGGIKGKTGTGLAATRGRRTAHRLSLSPRAAAIAHLREHRRPLVLDDFHYLPRELQGSVIRALKPLIFEGLPAVLIAIPHRRYDAVKVEREITGRLETIDIPTWELDELMQISAEGFPLLNVELDQLVARQLAQEAYGSPHLMQEFCKELARSNGVDETAPTTVRIGSASDELFKNVAKGTGRVIYDKLAKGPRQRSDRIQRPFRQGGAGDIYEVVLLALARLGPGLERIEYEQLRFAIREILADSVPRAHEVTRVLEKMAAIAAEDEASTPVLDWDRNEQVLHITDPFFAFFLKWGVERAA